MNKTNTTLSVSPVKQTLHGMGQQFYSMIVWLLILFGGMVLVGSFFVPNLHLSELLSGILVGAISIAFGVGSTRLLHKDIRQTAPVIWF